MKFFWTIVVVAVAAVVAWGERADAQEYRVQPGDVLRVEVIEDPSLNRDVLVSPDGQISIPLAGSVRAGGRTIDQVRASLTAALDDNFSIEPNVFVGLQSVREREAPQETEVEAETLSVYVLGEVANPGVVEVEPGTTVLQVFALAGGFGDFAARKRIQLRRVDASGTEKIYPLNYEAIEQGLSPNGTVRVAEGDTFIVPVRRLFE